MSDFGKETCATAIAATVADPSSSSNRPSNVITPALCADDELPLELCGPLLTCWQSLFRPLLQRMDQQMDCRLVSTIEHFVFGVLKHRNRANGLLLSELGAFICGANHAPAGTKRLSNLLRSPKWEAQEIESHLWSQAVSTWQDMIGRGETVLMLWDESVLEKPESLESEGLSPVRSSKAKRLSRIKEGFYRPPGPPVFVPGFNWLTLLLIGRKGPPVVAAMKWWGTRLPVPKPKVQDKSVLEEEEPTATETSSEPLEPPSWLQQRADVLRCMLKQCRESFGPLVIHVFDRGYAGGPWLSALDEENARFIVRWCPDYQLENKDGIKKAAWKLLRGKKFSSKRMVRDGKHHREQEVGLKVVQVIHPSYNQGLSPLWLVVASRGQGHEPWYLLTNEPLEVDYDAWEIVFSYARRWQIETSFRFNKTELAFESPRLKTWQCRHKLLILVTLVYALLLALLKLPEAWREQLLRHWCHRTGKRSRETPTPLSRIRTALAALLLSLQPEIPSFKSSG